MHYPSPTDIDHKYMALVDVWPDTGPLDGYFSFVHRNRVISGKLFRTFDELIKFLVSARDNVKSILSPEEVMRLKIRIVLFDRLGEGRVLLPDDLRSAAADIYFRVLEDKRHRSTYGDVLERAAQRAKTMAERLIASIPNNMRASPALLNNEDPVHALASAGIHWRIPLNGLNSQFNAGVLSAYEDYRNNPNIPQDQKKNLGQLDTLLRRSLVRVLKEARIQLHKDYKKRVGDAAYPYRVVGLNNVISQAEAEFNATYARDLLIKVLRNMINFNDEASLDSFISSEVAERYTLGTAFEHLFAPRRPNDLDPLDVQNFPRNIRQTSGRTVADNPTTLIGLNARPVQPLRDLLA